MIKRTVNCESRHSGSSQGARKGKHNGPPAPLAGARGCEAWFEGLELATLEWALEVCLNWNNFNAYINTGCCCSVRGTPGPDIQWAMNKGDLHNRYPRKAQGSSPAMSVPPACSGSELAMPPLFARVGFRTPRTDKRHQHMLDEHSNAPHPQRGQQTQVLMCESALRPANWAHGPPGIAQEAPRCRKPSFEATINTSFMGRRQRRGLKIVLRMVA